MTWQVKDLLLSLPWHGLLLWYRFDSWPRNFYMLWAQPKGRKEGRKEGRKGRKEGRRKQGKEKEGGRKELANE